MTARTSPRHVILHRVSGSERLTADDFAGRSRSGELPTDEPSSLEDLERQEITDALRRCNGNISRAATERGLSRQALYRRIEKFGLNEKN